MKRKDPLAFSTSFLDIICCALGAVLCLLLVVSMQSSRDLLELRGLLDERNRAVRSVTETVGELDRAKAALDAELGRLSALHNAAEGELLAMERGRAALADELARSQRQTDEERMSASSLRDELLRSREAMAALRGALDGGERHAADLQRENEELRSRLLEAESLALPEVPDETAALILHSGAVLSHPPARAAA